MPFEALSCRAPRTWHTSMNQSFELIGESRCIQALRSSIKRLVQRVGGAQRPPPVLIQGETGTGKGLVARLLHQASARSAGPFVDINCAAIPDTLLEAELFGYERGAFTEARRSKPGLFHAAHRGTIFLDEITLLPIGLQAKLLKVVEERTVRRLGATAGEPVDVWILSATNEHVARRVQERQFREDLYHRLTVMALNIPPLRERDGDIVRLAEHFLNRACADYGLAPRRLSVDACERILAYPWPGNVRELSNVIERATVLSDSLEISWKELGLVSGTPVEFSAPIASASPQDQGPLKAAVRDHLVEAFNQTGGNISRMAALLGVSRATARAHLKKFGLSGGRPGRPAGAARRRPDQLAAGAPLSEAPRGLDRAGSFRWERRFVASMRVSLSQKPSEGWSESGRILELVIDKVHGFGGRVEALSPEGLDASFGVLPADEAPRRAGHAALAVLTAVERNRQSGENWQPPSIVVHTDHVLVGHFGGGTPCVDRDSQERLAEQRDALVGLGRNGEILLTPSAAPLFRRRFSLEEGQTADGARGRHYRLIGTIPDGLGAWGQLGPFVGRDSEMERLLAHAAATLEGVGQVVGVVGEPGVGKSRLIRELVRRLEHRPWRVLEATCDGGGPALYYMAAELLRSYFSVRAHEPVEHVRSVIAGVLATSETDLDSVRLPVETLLGVPTDDPRWTDLDPDERRQRTHEAIVRLLVLESKRRPLLIVIEDAHWIDAESHALLTDIVSAVATDQILAVVSYRPEYQSRWSELAGKEQLRVEPLPDASATELLDSLTGHDDSLPTLKRQLVEWTSGNPFFLEESVRSLAEAGILAGTRGAYVLTGHVARIEIPPTVEDILAIRIDRLAPTARHMVQTAAVIGNQVPYRLLAAVVDISAEELAAATMQLRDSELLYERRVAGEVDLFFKHALTHEVARLGIPLAVRTGLHRAILKEVEKLYADAAEERVDLFTLHAVGGEVWEKAVEYLDRAGHRALASAATQKAAECFAQVLDALARLPATQPRWVDAIDAHLNLRDVLWPLARMPEVLEHLREADKLAGRLDDTRRQGWIDCYLCQYFWAVGEYEQALEASERARIIAGKLGDLALAAESGFYRGIAFHALGRLTDAERALTLSVDEVDAALATGAHRFPSGRFGKNGPIIVRGFLSLILADQGRFAEGQSFGRAAVDLASDADSPFALVAAMGSLGSLYFRKGDPSNAIPVLERALATCRTYRLNNWLSHVCASLGRAYLEAGRGDEGVALLEEAVGFGEKSGILVNRSLWLTYLGEGYLVGRQMAKARDAAEQALAWARSRKERGHEAWALHLLAQVSARSGFLSSDKVYPILEQVLVLATKLGLRPLEARCHRTLGVLLAREDPGAAAHHSGRAMAVAGEIDMALRESLSTL